MENFLKGKFFNPPEEFRPVPFWFWNYYIDEEQIKSQLAQIKEKGCRGAIVHARTGLKTPYLSSEWFNKVRIAAEECKKLGLEMWLCFQSVLLYHA